MVVNGHVILRERYDITRVGLGNLQKILEVGILNNRTFVSSEFEVRDVAELNYGTFRSSD